MREIDPRTRDGVQSRAKVDLLLPDDLPAALAEARSNPHPRYRCQSLTSVAAKIQDEAKAAAVLREALNAAKEQSEPNRIVSAAAWPVSVWIRRSLGDMSAVVAELLEVIGREPNPVRRADALLLLFEAVMTEQQLRHDVLVRLLEACSATRSWKARRILQFAALAVATVNGKIAEHIVSLIPESRESRRARQMLKRRQWLGPHHFVPSCQKR